MSETGEKPSNEESKTSSKREINRRKFLQAAALGIGSLILKSGQRSSETQATTKPSHEDRDEPGQPILESETRERFIELGIENFWTFYNTVIQTTEKFGTPTEGYYFNNIFSVCNKVANGEINSKDNPDLSVLSEGWGDAKERAVEAAQEHIKSLDIIVYQDASDDPESVRRQQLALFAQKFAPLVLALPPELHLVYFHTPQLLPDKMLTYSFAKFDPPAAWSRFYHETTHSVDTQYERVKPYVTAEDYLEYITSYFTTTDKLLTSWLDNSNPEQVVSFWNGPSTQWGDESTRNKDQISLLERAETTLLGQQSSEINNIYRFRQAVWSAGRKLQVIHNKEAANQTLTEEERNLKNNSDIQQLMGAAIRETFHLLVNPQPEAFWSEPKYTSTAVTEAQKETNDLRVRTFATFTLNKEEDTMTQVKRELGID